MIFILCPFSPPLQLCLRPLNEPPLRGLLLTAEVGRLGEVLDDLPVDVVVVGVDVVVVVIVVVVVVLVRVRDVGAPDELDRVLARRRRGRVVAGAATLLLIRRWRRAPRYLLKGKYSFVIHAPLWIHA